MTKVCNPFFAENNILLGKLDHPEPTKDRCPFGYGPCHVCKTNKICVLFINCQHLACCDKCGNECTSCRICGQGVVQRLHVFEPS
jgi:hypothetical protein